MKRHCNRFNNLQKPKQMSNRNMNYFGTSLDSSGHYIWEIVDGERLRGSNLNFRSIPFDPETIAHDPKDKYYHHPKGTVKYFHVEEYTVCYIEGSCKDTRGGTKSVFWVKENIPWQELQVRILAMPLAQKMFAQMAFEVKWPTIPETEMSNRKTAMQAAIELIAEDAKYKSIPYQSAAYKATTILQSLLPTERANIEQAFKQGAIDNPYLSEEEDSENAKDYYDKTYGE